MAPDGKADYAFLLDGLYNLKENGTMVAILPHGVLFRGAREEKIRRQLIENNLIDTIIGLPEKLFDVTSIPVCILVFKKNRENKDIFFIDASNEFEKGKNQNSLTDEMVNKIYETYKKRQFVDKYANDVDISEIEENDYNLNIPRYVDTFEPEPPVDIFKLIDDTRKINEEMKKTENDIKFLVDDLVGTNPQAEKELKAIKEFLHDK